MKSVTAKKQFSHYHLGNFDDGQTRIVPDDVAKALEGMGLVDIAAEKSASTKEAELTPKRPGPRGKAK